MTRPHLPINVGVDDGKDDLRSLRPRSEDLWVDDKWRGPKSVRVFVRMNWGSAAWNQLALTGMAFGGLWNSSIPKLYAIPLVLIIGAAANLVVMFLFAHGHIAESSDGG